MRALVTGAGGFVGRHLIEHLVASGDEVVGTDRAGSDSATTTTTAEIDDVLIDVCDTDAVTALIERVNPEVIYHLAGDADVGGSWHHPLETFHANAVGTLSLLTAARTAGRARILCISSADVYGRVPADELPIDESRPMAPVSPYAASKVAADMIGYQAWLGHEQEVIRVRAFNHLGPGQSERFVAPAVATRIVEAERSGATTIPVGNLTPRRDLTDVRDVVRAYRLLAQSGSPGEAYNVCSGSAISVGELVEQLIAASRAQISAAPDPELQRPVDTPVLLGDHTKLTEATGWRPEIPLAQTLADLLADCRARHDAALSRS